MEFLGSGERDFVPGDYFYLMSVRLEEQSTHYKPYDYSFKSSLCSPELMWHKFVSTRGEWGETYLVTCTSMLTSF